MSGPMGSGPSAPEAPAASRWSAAGGLALLVLAGMAGNWFKFTLFYNADFIFGSIFALMALQRFGLLRGTAAALVVSLPLYALWGHPYAVLIMTAEVAAVGLLRRRWRLGFVQADALYWVCLGLPLVFLCYHVVMKTPTQATWFIVVKDMVNGIANALIARYSFLGLNRGRTKSAYREVVYNLLILFVLCPGLLLIALDSRRDLAAVDAQVRSHLLRDGRVLDVKVATWLKNRAKGIATLAGMAGSRSPGAMQDPLEQALEADENFVRIGLHDSEATVVAHAPVLDQEGRPFLGLTFKDRPYVPVLRRTLAPLFTEVVPGRVGLPGPLVGAVAPVLVGGAFRGYVIGVLRLDQIAEVLRTSLEEQGALYTLLDQKGRVILSNRDGQRIGEPLARGAGSLVTLDEPFSQWLPPVRPNTPAMARWAGSCYVAEFPTRGPAAWKLVLEQPVAPFQKALFAVYVRKLGLLLLMVLVSMALAELLVRRLARTYEQLALLTHDLPIKLASPEVVIPWPESRVQETSQLILNFRTMAEALSEHFHRLREANALLEQRVAERTQALEMREAQFRLVFERAPIGIAVVDSASGAFLSVNRRLEEIVGFQPGALQGRTFQSFTHPDHLEADLASVAKLASGAVAEVDKEKRYLQPSGAQVWARLRMVRLPGAPGEPVRHLTLVEDITEAKRALESEVRARKAESLVLMAGSIAHDFNNLFQALVVSMGIVELQCRDNAAVQEPLATAQEVLRRATALSWKMLDFAGRAGVRLVERPLGEVVAAWAAGVDPGVWGGTLDLDLGEAPPVKVDPERLRTVLDSFLVNAREAMAEAGTARPRVAVKVSVGSVGGIEADSPCLWVTERPKTPWTVCLAFSNAGPVPAPEVLARMFDPFFTTKALGRGLGLPSALGILQAHGVSIQVVPGAEEGLSFRLHFPPGKA